MTTTPTQWDTTTMPITLYQAADLTWNRVSVEADPGADHRLSADIVHDTEEGFPVVSVIHLEDRRHWNLIVFPDRHEDRDPAHKAVPVADLAGVLQTVAVSTQLRVFTPDYASWLVLAEVLPNAYTTWSASTI